jgi:hypothetical protein
MRKLILAVPVLATLAALAVPSLASAANTSNIIVPAGTTMNLGGQDVKGNVDIYGSVVNYGKTLFEKNVTVHPGGSFKAGNWPVTINGNLTITDPAADSENGFWGSYTDTDQSQDHPWLHLNEVKGNLTYTIDQDYQQYHSPTLNFSGGTKVDGNFTYSTGGRLSQVFGDGLIAAPQAMGNLVTLGSTNIS